MSLLLSLSSLRWTRVHLYCMYCHFSASCSHPPILLTSLYPLCILLKKLCELCLSETPVFYIGICLFVLYVLPFFSQLQPLSNPVDSSISQANSSEAAMWVMPVWDSCVFFFVIDRCWLNFILHVLLFFSQLQPPPNPSDISSPGSSSEKAVWVIPVWDLCVCVCVFFLLLTDVD